MSQAPKVRARSAGVVPAWPVIQTFNPAAVSKLLIDVPQTRHEAVEFAENLFFNDLCGQIVQGELVLLAGAPGSNKSTLSRQLVLDHALRGGRVLMLLTEEPAERATAGFLTMASDLPPPKVRGALSNIHVETGI